VPEVSPERYLVKLPVLYVPVWVQVLIRAVELVPQSKPFSKTLEPPADSIFPLRVAEVVVMDEAVLVVTLRVATSSSVVVKLN